MTEERKENLLTLRERIYAYWLSRTDGIGAVKAGKLLEFAGSYEAVYNMKKQDLDRCIFLNEREKWELTEGKTDIYIREKEYFQMKEEGIEMLLPSDSAYPNRLKHIYDMPQWLYVKGEVPDPGIPTAAIIGARSCTPYGRQEAEYLGSYLAEAGVSVISGLAYGIDGAAHKGIVEKSGCPGKPFAVLGSGIDVCYPEKHRPLYEAVAGKGGILSEYGPGTAPVPSRFPIRNRIISGLSDLVIVVEARKRSGSLITADLALEQGKEVFALPGRRTDPLSEGCNRLIQQGAGILTDPDELLEFLKIKQEKTGKNHKKNINGLAKSEKMVYSCLDSTPRHVEAIMEQCSLSAGECLTALLELEMKGFIVQPLNHHYTRKLE